MRFQVGDIVRLYKGHHAKSKYPREGKIVSINPESLTSVRVDGIGSAGIGNWYPQSLRLVRRPE